jgi:hypothetical protein
MVLENSYYWCRTRVFIELDGRTGEGSFSEEEHPFFVH